MRRFLMLLRNEFRLLRTALVVHIIAIIQPTLMFLLMSVVMVFPTFDMYVVQSGDPAHQQLVTAMEQVGSPIGLPYIHPILIDPLNEIHRQVIEVTEQDDVPTAVQHYGYIDSNLVKNLRNRLTASLLILWNQELGKQAITINEYPLMDWDVSYLVYFGMAMIPLAVYLAAAMTGGYLIAQDFEHNTILEYRLSPTPYSLILAVKLTRLVLTGLLGGAILYLAVGLSTGSWASSALMVVLAMLPIALIAGCIGLIGGLVTRSSLPSFLIALASAFLFWLMGSGFGLAAGFSPIFEHVSRLIPNTPVIEMVFPYFYSGLRVASNPTGAALLLGGYCVSLLGLVVLIYRRRVLAIQR